MGVRLQICAFHSHTKMVVIPSVSSASWWFLCEWWLLDIGSTSCIRIVFSCNRWLRRGSVVLILRIRIKSILNRCLYSVCIYLYSMCATMFFVDETGWLLYRSWAPLLSSSDHTCDSLLGSMKMPIGWYVLRYLLRWVKNMVSLAMISITSHKLNAQCGELISLMWNLRWRDGGDLNRTQGWRWRSHDMVFKNYTVRGSMFDNARWGPFL